MHSLHLVVNRLTVALGTAIWANKSLRGRTLQDTGATDEADDSSTLVTVGEWLAVVVLVLFSGLFSGLTLGLLGLDTNQLAVRFPGPIVAEAGEPDKRRYAQQILPLRQRGNLLLCTLLLGNVAVNSLMSILLAGLTSGLVGFLSSTALIVIFGEIIPQATCSRYPLCASILTGYRRQRVPPPKFELLRSLSVAPLDRHPQLLADIGSRAIPLVKVIIVLLFIVAYPISRVLDWALGKEVGDFYDPQEFDQLIKQHVDSQQMEAHQGKIMQGAIRFRTKLARDVTTERSDVFCVRQSDRLNEELMTEIFRRGFSRLPVLDDNDENRVTGVLFAKDLLLISPAANTPVATVIAFFNRGDVVAVNADATLDKVLRTMTTAQQHFAVVMDVDSSRDDTDPVMYFAGIVTLQDIMSEILQESLAEEFDEETDGTGVRNPFSMWQLRGLGYGQAYNNLDPALVRGIVAHLLANVPAFSAHNEEGQSLSWEAATELVRISKVMDLLRPDDVSDKDVPWLYERGSPTAVCSLLLEGKMQVVSGEDKIESSMGPYDVLGERALLVPDYKPDFSARLSGQRALLLRIERENFCAAFRAVPTVEHTTDTDASGDAETPPGGPDSQSAGRPLNRGKDDDDAPSGAGVGSGGTLEMASLPPLDPRGIHRFGRAAGTGFTIGTQPAPGSRRFTGHGSRVGSDEGHSFWSGFGHSVVPGGAAAGSGDGSGTGPTALRSGLVSRYAVAQARRKNNRGAETSPVLSATRPASEAHPRRDSSPERSDRGE